MVHFIEQFSISIIIVMKPCQFAEVTTPKWITAPACDSSMVHKWKHLKIKKVGKRNWAQVSGNTYCLGHRQFVTPHKEGISRLPYSWGWKLANANQGVLHLLKLNVRQTYDFMTDYNDVY